MTQALARSFPSCLLPLLLLALSAPAGAQDSAFDPVQALKGIKTKGRELPPHIHTRRDLKAFKGLTRKIDRKRVSVDWRQGVALKQVVAEVRKRSGLKVAFSKGALKLLGDAKLRLRLRKVRLRSLLELIAIQAHSGLRWRVWHGGVLWIGTIEEYCAPLVWRMVRLGLADYTPPSSKAPKAGVRLEAAKKLERGPRVPEDDDFG
jgi:hypothetical protein